MKAKRETYCNGGFVIKKKGGKGKESIVTKGRTWKGTEGMERIRLKMEREQRREEGRKVEQGNKAGIEGKETGKQRKGR